MDREAAVSFVNQLREVDDASIIDSMVKMTIESHIGSKRPIRISDKEKRRVINLLKTVIAFLEERLCMKPEMNVLNTRQSCAGYMDDLCSQNPAGRFEFLKSQWGFIHCLEHWGCLEAVETVGMQILEEIDNLSTVRGSVGPRMLPIPGPDTSNHDAAYSVLRASAGLITVLWSRRSQEDVHTHILDLVQGMDPWFRLINPEDQINGKPIREWLFSFLCNCTLSTLDERKDWIQPRQYCVQAITHFGEAAAIDDQMLEFGRGTCRSLFSNKDDKYFQNSKILLCVLENLAIQFKKNPRKEQTLKIFIELSGYYTIEYGEASKDLRIKLASFLDTLAENYFPQVPNVASIMEHYALALVVSDYDTYKGWRNLKSSDAVAISAILTNLEPQLQKFILLHDKTYTEFPAFLCDQIGTFVLSNYVEMIPADENSINVPGIRDFFGRFMELGVSPTCESETTEHVKQVAKLAVTSFMILLITRQDTKGFLDRLKKDGKFQMGVLTNICQCLRKVYQTLSKSGKIDEAIETMTLCCEASWMKVSLFCDMVSSSEDGVRNNFFSKDSIVCIVNEAIEDSASLLRIIHEHRAQKVVDDTLQTYIDRWVLTQKKFKILSPAALVKQWVIIQCKKIDGINHTDYLAPSICSLVPSLRKHKQESCIIIVEELLTYRKMENIDSQFLKRMENHIKDNTLSSENIIQRFKFLIDGGKHLASLGPKGQLDCITYMTEAVNLLLKCKEGKINVNVGDEIFELLPTAYFFLSLIKRLAYPMEKDYTSDITSGLKLYHEKPRKFNETECTLLSCILDMLSLEANVELQCEVYETMIKSRGKEFLETALQSGNLHHALCSSPLKDAFLEMVHKHSSSSTGMPYWRTCVTSDSLEAGMYPGLSMLPVLSYLELEDDTLKVKKTIEKLKHSVSDPENRFAAAHHYYNLAEIMIAKGLMNEALTCANEGYLLRNELLLECFTIEWGGETAEENKHVCKTFYPNPSRFSSVGSYCVGKNVPTPWNLLRCYLDSSLQTGTLHHMIGYSSEAENLLYHGKEISSIQNFPVFSVGFSIALGNVHCKEKHWSSATKELEAARKSLDVCGHNLCKKCILVLKVKLNQLEGDIYLNILKNKGENSKDDLRKAKDSFEKAKSNLENEEWVNSVSIPERQTPKENDPVLCYSDEKSDKDCWHCQTSIIQTSASVEDSTNLKWEVIRRRYLLQVVTKLAKLSKLEEDVNEERKLLMEGIYVLVGRSTFEKLELSSSFVEKFVRERVAAEALGAEQAAILYKTCCFSLRHAESREKAILSRENVLLGLKMAFVLSREVPKVHEKVSQTLAVVYACSSKDDTPSDIRVTKIQSALYFHQCSIGSLFNNRFLSQDQIQMEVDDSPDLRRVLAPHSVKELEESITCYSEILSKVLPESMTVLCISMLSDKSYGILQKFLPQGHPPSTWLMISRFRLKIGPQVVILPISEKLKAFPFQKDNNSTCQWSCPWAGNTFDQVAPVLKWVLEEDIKLNYSGQKLSEIMKKKMKLDGILGDFLRNLEDSWLGPWKYFLLGKWPGDDNVDTLTIDMDQVLEENFGCYIGKFDKTVNRKVPDAKKKCRDPIVIVSPPATQMVPIESIPLLQEQEAYRMPSVGSILQSVSKNKMLNRNKSLPVSQEEEVYKNPEVNPCNCYYLIKQDDGDFVELIKCFEEWSKKIDIKGKAGNVVNISVDELKEALASHELFIWVGHGNGTKYIPETEIRKISNCCAAVLMGCSSGFIYSKNHGMEGAPLAYLLAGSYAVVANLWSVYATGIIPFTKNLFETWIKSTSSDRIKCEKRKSLKRKFTGTSICEHESNLGSCMPKARAACKRRYLDGATAVIYGIPTQFAKISHSVPEEEPGEGRAVKR